MNNLPYSDSSQELLHIKITQGALRGGENAITRHGLIKSVYLRNEAQKIKRYFKVLWVILTHTRRLENYGL